MRRIYGAVTLFTGDVVFDEIGVLQPHEFNGKAIFDMAHDADLGLADRDDNTDRRAQVRRDADCRARLRQVDHSAGDIGAVRQYQARHGVAGGETIMTPVFRQIKDLPVCEPGELRRKLVPLAQRRRDAHGKPIFQNAGYFAFEPAQVVDIGDDPLTRLTGNRRDQSHPAWRHIGHLAWKLAPVSEHISPKQVDLHALMAATFLCQRQDHRFGQWQSHRYRGPERISAVFEPKSLSLTMGYPMRLSSGNSRPPL